MKDVRSPIVPFSLCVEQVRVRMVGITESVNGSLTGGIEGHYSINQFSYILQAIEL